MASKTAKTAQEVLMADFQALVSDTERLLEHTATLAGDPVSYTHLTLPTNREV